MKKIITRQFGLRSFFQLMMLISLSLVFVGCQKEIAPANTSARDAELQAAAPAKGTESIAAIAINQGFSELVAALSYVDEELNAGLVNLFLNGKDQYTVFAPTNEAFYALYKTLNVTKISELPAPLVLSVLQYHVTGGRRAANSVVPKNGEKTISTLLPNATFSVNKMAEITAVGNTANIVKANVSASNGIIHAIDAVLLPIKL